MPEAALDNDILIKGAAYGILAATADAFSGSVGVLGLARYVVRGRLDRDKRLVDHKRASQTWSEFLATAEELEPSGVELALAIAIESAASERGLPLDAGESQLCAICISRGSTRLVSGDKRALCAAEALIDRIPALAALAGKWCCLEQLILLLADRIDPSDLCTSVCAEAAVDKALAICMSCSSGGQWSVDGLTSYINDLRGQAPTLLSDAP